MLPDLSWHRARSRAVLLGCLGLLAGCDSDAPGPGHDIFSFPFPDGGGACSSTCGGCCQGEQCQTGVSAAACGAGGAACQACSIGTTCQYGTCTGSSTCNANTCGGCCTPSGSCEDGDTNAACGSGGATCATCGSGNTCSGGACSGTAQKYKVILVSVTWTAGGMTCGELNDCDFYVKLDVNGTTAQSTTMAGENNATFNEELLTATASDITSSFAVEVYDEDGNADDLYAKCSPSVTTAILQAGQLTLDSCLDADGNKKVIVIFSFQSA